MLTGLNALLIAAKFLLDEALAEMASKAEQAAIQRFTLADPNKLITKAGNNLVEKYNKVMKVMEDDYGQLGIYEMMERILDQALKPGRRPDYREIEESTIQFIEKSINQKRMKRANLMLQTFMR